MTTTRMVRTVVGAVAASAAAVLLAVPATAGTVHRSAAGAAAPAGAGVGHLRPRPDLSGLRVQSPHTAPIYLIDPEGYRRWIPSPATYNALFRDWNGVVTDLGANLIAPGPDLDGGAFLGRAPGAARVYLVSNGEKRWIVSPATMDKYWFDWSKIRDVPAAALHAIPNGPDWS